MKDDHAADYARAAVNGTLYAPHVDGVKPDNLVPRYVKLQCADFLKMWDGDDPKYFVDRVLLRKICRILKLLIMAKGPKVGHTVYDAFAGFDWLIVTALLCCVYRDDKTRRRYETALLEICRKNGKTFVVAVLFLLLFLLEPPFSRFFSVAPDGELAREIKQALEPLITINAEALENDLDVRRDWVRSKRKKTEYKPLNYSTNRMDGKEPNVFIADEIGALPTNYAIESMRSGQLMVTKNRLGFCISTKYPTIDNPMEDEVKVAKRSLDGIDVDETLFALLYEPDDPKEWMTDNTILAHGNPLALEMEAVWNDLLKKRSAAIAVENKRENFLTKHCNIIYSGAGTETFVPVDAVRAGSCECIDFSGRELYVGVDLAMSNDNCAVAVVFEEDDEIVCDVKAFIPEERIEEKSKYEHVDYRQFIAAGNCVACGDMVVDYSVIERFVESIEEEYGGTVVSIGYDRYNALSSSQKWEEAGYTTVEIKQHSSVLHPPTKLLSEKIESRKFRYRANKMLEINFQNAKCTYDTNLNRYVSKKRSNGKVDMVMAIIDAVYLLQQDVLFGDDDFVCQ
ncbi:terminase TerL endonuclease subunit [Paraeggerthella sp.]|uniref:terminase TerL endonuclease subunit n=1 Tax=Paraeggerthella sp. TaxID=2897350 RepID=UPI003AB7639A